MATLLDVIDLQMYKVCGVPTDFPRTVVPTWVDEQIADSVGEMELWKSAMFMKNYCDCCVQKQRCIGRAELFKSL